MFLFYVYIRTSLVAQMVKRLSTMRETWVRALGWEDPQEKEMAIHSSTVAWKISWTEEPGTLQSMGSQRVRDDWATELNWTMRETQVRSLSQEDPLEKEMAIHSSTVAWKIPWTEEPGTLQSMGSQRVGHDWATSHHTTHTSKYYSQQWIVF